MVEVTSLSSRQATSGQGLWLYFIIALVIVAETVALALLKSYALHGELASLIAGGFIYLLVPLLLMRSFHYAAMGIVNLLWSAFSILFGVLVGLVFFDEQLASMNVVGILLILFGVLILRSATRHSDAPPV